MSSVPAASPPPPAARTASSTPAIIILGADALLAARPATPNQLANACYAAGYTVVVPSSWGDELVAAGSLREIAARGQDSVVLCSCPRVADRMRRVGNLSSHLLSMVSPPVAAARYLRARAGATGVHVTYVGECPGGADPSIDRHATPAALLRSLGKRGINPVDQPLEIEERLLRDGRRFYSLPGGAPAPNWLYAEKRGYTLAEPTARDYLAEVAFRVGQKERRILDLGPRLGCACSGAIVGEPWSEARERVAALEPPRAVHEILDHDVPVELGAPMEPWTGSTADGDQTLSIPLTELAALHDPDAKAAPVLAPLPPLPRRSGPSAPVVGEPATLAGPIPTAASPAAAAQAARFAPPASMPSDAAAAHAGAHPPGSHGFAAGATSPNAADASSVAPPFEPATGSGPVLAIPALAGEPSTNPSARIVWPQGDGGRTGGRSEPTTEPRTGAALHETWTGSVPVRRRQHLTRVAVACAVLAVAASSVVMLRVLGPSSHVAAKSHAATPSVPVATPASGDSTRPSGASATTPDGSTAANTAADSQTPRLPIGPASGAELLTHQRPFGARDDDAPLASSRFHANPAQVYTPGAAPIPRGDEYDAHAASQGQAASFVASSPAAMKASAAFSNALTPEAAAEMANIRTQIVGHRRRADSLRRVVDSLGVETQKP